MVFPLLAFLVQAVAPPSAPLTHAEIWFDAKASVADFQGRASTATGTVAWVEVRWQDIDTNNGTRNRHMLKTVDAEHFPVIRFDLTETSTDTGQVHLTGTLAMHGVAKSVVWPALVRIDHDSVFLSADFPVDMRDYGIKPPVKFIIARMGAVVEVHVRLVFAGGKNQTRG